MDDKTQWLLIVKLCCGAASRIMIPPLLTISMTCLLWGWVCLHQGWVHLHLVCLHQGSARLLQDECACTGDECPCIRDECTYIWDEWACFGMSALALVIVRLHCACIGDECACIGDDCAWIGDKCTCFGMSAPFSGWVCLQWGWDCLQWGWVEYIGHECACSKDVLLQGTSVLALGRVRLHRDECACMRMSVLATRMSVLASG